jgi:hypothetical protein
MTFKVTLVDPGNLQKKLSGLIRSEVQRLGQSLVTEIKQRTPVDTGRARAGWRDRTTNSGYEITNTVPYIGVLDKGRHMTSKGMRGSKQAPKGIVGPSLNSIKRKN